MSTYPNLHVSAPSSRADKADKPSLVELKNGKLVFKQKTLAFEKMSETMQGTCAFAHASQWRVRAFDHAEIVKFREMLEQRLEAKEPPLSKVPEEHMRVIAKLVHERYAFNLVEDCDEVPNWP